MPWQWLRDYHDNRLDGGGRGSVLSALIALVGVGATLWLTLPSNGEKTDSDGKPSASVSTSAKPSGGEQPNKPDPIVSDAATSGASQEIAPSNDGAVEGAKEANPLKLNTSLGCDDLILIDFDSHPFTKRINKNESGGQIVPEAVDMTWGQCAPLSLKTMSSAHAGVLIKGEEVTKKSCEAAAFGGGLEVVDYGFDWKEDSGLLPGGTMCVVTDRKAVIQAKILPSDNDSLFFSVSTFK